MLISNLFSRKVFRIIVLTFVILDFLFAFFLGIFFLISLNKNSKNIESIILDNNREIQNSFISFLTRRISLIKQDLFLIGKHSDIYFGKLNMEFNQESEFYKKYNSDLENSCLVNGSKISESPIKESYYNKISDKENPLISYINYYYNNNEKGDSENMIKDLKEDNLFNKLSFHEGIKDENNDNINNYIGYACYMKSIFKSIFIKESISQGPFISLNSIFLFMNNNIFQYLPNETNVDSIKHLSFYSTKILCNQRFYSRCVSDFLKPNFNYSINIKYENNISFVEYFHYFDEKYIFYSCINLKDVNFNNINYINNYLCIEHNINYLLQRQFNFKNLTTMKIVNNITDLISLVNNTDNNKLLLRYTLKYDTNDFYQVYNYFFPKFKKKHIFTEENSEIELFHLIYFDLFKYKKESLTEEEIDELIEEYDNNIYIMIVNTINELEFYINTTKNICAEKEIEIEQTFLYSKYNKSGLIDYENGRLEKGIFTYLITPILDTNVYYKKNTFTKINIDNIFTGNEVKILGYNIIISQNTLNIWNNKILDVMILLAIRWLIFF